MSDHIVKAYDKELEILGRKIAEMGGIAEKMLSDAMDALVDFDTQARPGDHRSRPAPRPACSATSRNKRS